MKAKAPNLGKCDTVLANAEIKVCSIINVGKGKHKINVHDKAIAEETQVKTFPSILTKRRQ